MFGKIILIEEIIDYCYDLLRYDGFRIKTDNVSFLILISNMSNCCENWGYLSSEDSNNFQKFYGQEILNISLSNEKSERLIALDFDLYGEDIQFVTFTTNQDILQFAVYNSHDGYYGHNIFILKETVQVEELLASLL